MKKREIKQKQQTDKLVYEMTVMQWTERECMVDNIRKKVMFVRWFVHLFILSFFYFFWLFHPRQRNQFIRMFQSHLRISLDRDFVARKIIIYFVIFLCFLLFRLETLRGSKRWFHCTDETFRFISFPSWIRMYIFFSFRLQCSRFYHYTYFTASSSVLLFAFNGVATNSTSKHTRKKSWVSFSLHS